MLTGISGFIGMHCAAELLRQGYIVRGSLRSLAKSEGVTKLISKVVNPNGNLEYCALDLLKDEGWEEAMGDCDYLMHVASPFFSTEPKDENDLIKPAVEGTRRALSAAAKAGIKRVVLTSSMVAMLGDVMGDEKIDQQSWTNVNAKHATAYIKSKTMAEKKAWEIAKTEGLELATIHPGPVYGPTLSDKISGESMETIHRVISGGMPQVIEASINMSDVRDVAKIHVAALENSAAAGQRFIVASEKAYSFLDIAGVLKSNGYDKVSTKKAPNWLVKFMANFNRELKGLLPYIGKKYHGDIRPTMDVFGWSPVAFEPMMLDTAKSVQAIAEE